MYVDVSSFMYKIYAETDEKIAHFPLPPSVVKYFEKRLSKKTRTNKIVFTMEMKEPPPSFLFWKMSSFAQMFVSVFSRKNEHRDSVAFN